MPTNPLPCPPKSLAITNTAIDIHAATSNLPTAPLPHAPSPAPRTLPLPQSRTPPTPIRPGNRRRTPRSRRQFPGPHRPQLRPRQTLRPRSHRPHAPPPSEHPCLHRPTPTPNPRQKALQHRSRPTRLPRPDPRPKLPLRPRAHRRPLRRSRFRRCSAALQFTQRHEGGVIFLKRPIVAFRSSLFGVPNCGIANHASLRISPNARILS
jgi:hypothetical protein